MRKLSLLVAVLVMGVFADAAKAGPDPPAGKYGIGIRVNDGTFSEVPVGEPVVFPAWKNGVLGMEVHGWVNLPNPGGQGYQWGVRHSWITRDTTEWPTRSTNYQFGPHNWNGPVVQGHWSMWVSAEFNWEGWGLWSYHEYDAEFELVITGPGFGGWLPRATCLAWGCW